MIIIIKILKKNNYNGVIIPDHTPALNCSAPWHAGMAYAVGYIKGLINSYYEHSGVNLPEFHTFYSNSIEILNMDLTFKHKIEDNK